MFRSGLHSVLTNLLSNALKYAEPDRRPRIAVSTVLVDGRLLRGPVFGQPAGAPGRGRVAVASIVGRGTTFRLYLPK